MASGPDAEYSSRPTLATPNQGWRSRARRSAATRSSVSSTRASLDRMSGGHRGGGIRGHERLRSGRRQQGFHGSGTTGPVRGRSGPGPGDRRRWRCPPAPPTPRPAAARRRRAPPVTPPTPMIGSSGRARWTSCTARTATGWMAGPDSPPPPPPRRGRRVSGSMARPGTVLISVTASAPASATACGHLDQVGHRRGQLGPQRSAGHRGRRPSTSAASPARWANISTRRPAPGARGSGTTG